MKSIFNVGIVLCVLFLLFGCSAFGYQSPRYIKLAHEITAKTAKKLKEQKGLFLAGTGGRMMDDIQMMMMGFDFYEILDIENARKLLIYAVQEYLSDINSNEEIRPYLHNYPFTAQNLEIEIFFHNPDGSERPIDKLAIAFANEGKVSYSTYAPKNYVITRVHEETYEEALQIVSEEGSRLSLKSVGSQ